jgi:hypothetical protein
VYSADASDEIDDERFKTDTRIDGHPADLTLPCKPY